MILSLPLKGTAVKALKNVPYNSELNLWIGDKRLVKLIYEVCIVFMFEIYSALKICKQYRQMYYPTVSYGHNVGQEI